MIVFMIIIKNLLIYILKIIKEKASIILSNESDSSNMKFWMNQP